MKGSKEIAMRKDEIGTGNKNLPDARGPSRPWVPTALRCVDQINSDKDGLADGPIS